MYLNIPYMDAMGKVVLYTYHIFLPRLSHIFQVVYLCSSSFFLLGGWSIFTKKIPNCSCEAKKIVGFEGVLLPFC